MKKKGDALAYLLLLPLISVLCAEIYVVVRQDLAVLGSYREEGGKYVDSLSVVYFPGLSDNFDVAQLLPSDTRVNAI